MNEWLSVDEVMKFQKKEREERANTFLTFNEWLSKYTRPIKDMTIPIIDEDTGRTLKIISIPANPVMCWYDGGLFSEQVPIAELKNIWRKESGKTLDGRAECT